MIGGLSSHRTNKLRDMIVGKFLNKTHPYTKLLHHILQIKINNDDNIDNNDKVVVITATIRICSLPWQGTGAKILPMTL